MEEKKGVKADFTKIAYANVEIRQSKGTYSLMTYLPCKIHLPLNRMFLMDFNDNKFKFIIRQRKRVTTILDVENDFLDKNGNFAYPGFKLSNPIIQYKDGKYFDDFMVLGFDPGSAIYYAPCTIIITDFETDFSQDTVPIARIALSEFIRQYQMISRDMLALTPNQLFTQPIIDFGCFHQYSDKELALTADERSNLNFTRSYKPVNVNIKAHNMKQSGFDGQENSIADQLVVSLNDNKKEEFILSTLHDAEFQIYPMRNFKTAFLSCFFIIESVIQDYIAEKKLAKGISKTKLNQFRKEIGISYMLNIELPILMEGFNDSMKEFFGEIDAYRRLRNDIVHNKGEITEDQARNVKGATYKLIELLDIKVSKTGMSLEQIRNISPEVTINVLD